MSVIQALEAEAELLGVEANLGCLLGRTLSQNAKLKM